MSFIFKKKNQFLSVSVSVRVSLSFQFQVYFMIIKLLSFQFQVYFMIIKLPQPFIFNTASNVLICHDKCTSILQIEKLVFCFRLQYLFLVITNHSLFAYVKLLGGIFFFLVSFNSLIVFGHELDKGMSR